MSGGGVLTVGVAGIGWIGPGMPDWATAAALLREPAGWSMQPTVVPAPQRLPATERRRAGVVVRASIAVADAALADAAARGGAPVDAARLPTVFTSSTGDPLNCHLLCEALATPARPVSPTRFTNSVHNAAAGYWHIAAASRAPSTSLAAFDASFAAGLLEAAVQCRAHGGPVLLVACDVPYPAPLHALRPLADVVGVALLLVPPTDHGDDGAPPTDHSDDRVPPRALTLVFGSADDGSDGRAGDVAPTPAATDALEALRRSVPAARALPLLQALAGAAAATVVVEGLPGDALTVRVAAAAASLV